MSKVKIDILLPYWGEFHLLKKTVESVVAQTETNWRLMVFDDAYPSDEAPKYFKAIKDKRISYYRHKKNIGITKNFSHSINAATAEYCVVLGCDDMLLPNYIETALRNIGEADFYQPGVKIIDDNDVAYLPLADRVKRFLRPRKSGIYHGEKLAILLAAGNWLYFPSIVWRTKTIQHYGFDANHDNTQDVILELSIITDGGKLYVDNDVTFQYRRSVKSFSSRQKSKVGGRFREESEIYNHFAEKFQENNWRRAMLSAKLHATSRFHRVLAIISSRSLQ